MYKKLLVLMAVSVFGVALWVCADDGKPEAEEAKKAEAAKPEAAAPAAVEEKKAEAAPAAVEAAPAAAPVAAEEKKAEEAKPEAAAAPAAVEEKKEEMAAPAAAEEKKEEAAPAAAPAAEAVKAEAPAAVEAAPAAAPVAAEEKKAEEAKPEAAPAAEAPKAEAAPAEEKKAEAAPAEEKKAEVAPVAEAAPAPAAAPAAEAPKAEAAPAAAAAAAPAAEAKKGDPDACMKMLKTAVLYIPNRIIDALDIVTFDVGAGPEFGAEARITRWAQLGGMYTDGKYFIGKDYARQIGGGYSSGWNYELLCVTSERRYVEDTFGTTKDFLTKRKALSLALPKDDPTYETNVRDFWEIGANAGWLITAGAAVHPIEVADFLAGIFLIDLMKDDYGAAEKAKEQPKELNK